MAASIDIGAVCVTRVMEWEALFAPAPSSFQRATRRSGMTSASFSHRTIEHVGWNIYLHDRERGPTFPNARYVFRKADFDYWNLVNGQDRRGAFVNRNMFENSCLSVHRDIADPWEGESHPLDTNLTLDARAGPHGGPVGAQRRAGGLRAVSSATSCTARRRSCTRTGTAASARTRTAPGSRGGGPCPGRRTTTPC